MYKYNKVSTRDDQDNDIALLKELRTKLPRVMREQLNLQTLDRAYFLLAMLSDDACVHQLRTRLQEQYDTPSSSNNSIEQALELIVQLQGSPCDHLAPFKYRLPTFLGEYPIHSREINNKIKQFNNLIEAYYTTELTQELDSSELNKAYQDILVAIQKHYMGCNINSLWQLLKAMSAWSTSPVRVFLSNYSCLLSPLVNTEKSNPVQSVPPSKEPVNLVNQPFFTERKIDDQPFIPTFDYQINEAGRIADKSTYLSIHGFALKPGGHADALSKKIPDFLPWTQWQSNIRRQLSQYIDLPLNDAFFDCLQTVLQRLGVEFIRLNSTSYERYVSPFLNHKTIFNTLNEEMVFDILQEQYKQAGLMMETLHLSIIGRYLIRFLQGFQFNRGQALGIGANWGGVVSDANEAGVDAFRFNDPEWAAHFRNLSTHRQGPAEANMNAAIGIKYELAALLSSFEYMTQLQPSEYSDTLYNALVDNLITSLFPEPPYFENEAYTKYRHHYVVRYTNEGMQQINSFYQLDPQGTYFKTNNGDYKQTPMFRQAGSLVVEAFPRDTGSGDSFQSLSVANPLWPLQLQYAQSASTSMRGHLVYNPIGSDEFIPDAFYGQIIREADEVFIPFIGVVPKNFDKHFKQVELCASFVIRMLQSSRLMTYCPTFRAYYLAITTRFLPPIEKKTPPLPGPINREVNHKWQELDKILHSQERTGNVCHKAFFSLFKELIYSLYSLTKDYEDLHYYFVELTISPDAFEPASRATCERLIRELTALKPLQNINALQRYENILSYLSQLTDFFYPKPCDETAKAIAQQARLHVKPLLALQDIKKYFADLNQKYPAANISPKISPGLMYDALKYQAPSPAVNRDFYDLRHKTNFQSGYRDLDGNQIVKPSVREASLDIIVKTIGALLPLIRRNKTIFSLITQPFSQAYIAGYQAYRTHEQYKIFNAIGSGIGGFFYGIALGASHALGSIPMAFYNGLFVSVPQQHKTEHTLAISSAPANEPGLRVKAIMDIRDHLLQLMATANGHEPSSEQLINLLLTHVKKIHPSLLSKKEKEERYKQIVSQTFPLEPSAWQQLFEPVINDRNNKELQRIINQYALQIDSVLIYALYECMTSPNFKQAANKIIKVVIDKHKLKNPQDKALEALALYYVNNPEAQREDIAQYRFHGTALMKLKEKEQGLRKIQTWMNNALDMQWGLEALLSCSIDRYKIQLNPSTMADIVSELPDSMKMVLQELLSKPGNKKQTLKNYQLNESQKVFLLQCSVCYEMITSKNDKDVILDRIRISKIDDSSLSIKAREHLKLTRFIQREWHHQLLSMDNVQSIIDEIKRKLDVSYHPAIEELSQQYEAILQNPKNTKEFDVFYVIAMKIQRDHSIENPLHEWVNVTMNVFVNLLLDEATWINDKELINPLSGSPAVVQWLDHLMTHKHGVRALLAQQVEQAYSFDQAAWRCQHILHALEKLQHTQEHIKGTGMQKLLRVIGQNKNTITATGEQKAKEVDIKALCRHSVTMKHALGRVKDKVSNTDWVRPVDVPWRY